MILARVDAQQLTLLGEKHHRLRVSDDFAQGIPGVFQPFVLVAKLLDLPPEPLVVGEASLQSQQLASRLLNLGRPRAPGDAR